MIRLSLAPDLIKVLNASASRLSEMAEDGDAVFVEAKEAMDDYVQQLKDHMVRLATGKDCHCLSAVLLPSRASEVPHAQAQPEAEVDQKEVPKDLQFDSPGRKLAVAVSEEAANNEWSSAKRRKVLLRKAFVPQGEVVPAATHAVDSKFETLRKDIVSFVESFFSRLMQPPTGSKIIFL